MGKAEAAAIKQLAAIAAVIGDFIVVCSKLREVKMEEQHNQVAVAFIVLRKDMQPYTYDPTISKNATEEAIIDTKRLASILYHGNARGSSITLKSY